ncbi:MAG TPA: response regulator [Nevskiaceae bacterium]|nr:response regulator [Nevskiaceae bacterium]
MKTVVVVDDNAVITSIYRNKLKAAGYATEIASEGPAGLALIERTQPDLVLLDLVLPNLDGVEIIKRLRAQENFAKTPIVVLSGAYHADRIKQANDAGATRVLSKVNDNPTHVVEIVNELLSAD